MRSFVCVWISLICAVMSQAQDAPPAKAKPQVPSKKLVAFTQPEIPLASDVVGITREGVQIDLPDVVALPNGKTMAAYLAWDGEADSLHLAEFDGAKWQDVCTIIESGVLHRPCLAVEPDGVVWCFWGETNLNDDTVDLFAASFDGETLSEKQKIADSDASEAFADAGTDSLGRVWVTWQSFRAGEGDIYARVLANEVWSEEIAVTTETGGDWEPDLAFDSAGHGWVIYDSSRGNEFNLYLAKVSVDGVLNTYPVAHSEFYEARASIVGVPDGDGFWIAAERGEKKWGLDFRGHENATGINAAKRVLFGKFDIESSTFTENPLGGAGLAGAPVNRPAVGVGADGNPWVAYRYFKTALWRVAATSFRLESGTWSSLRRIPGSSYGQDRKLSFAPSATGDIALCWPSDLRSHKAHQTAGVYLASLPSAKSLPERKKGAQPREYRRLAIPSQTTPERAADDRHEWQVAGKSYGLFWGDVHRHTDVSNCRTGFDGCIVEHFRYAYDIGKIDFLGTSDHTDVGKIYHPYEWWHNQRMHDALHSPERFNTLYVYEREQPWPWGHRNIVFADRGGPVVYINRGTYRKSVWQNTFPVKNGVGAISPTELWDILKRYEKPVASISHTGATGMGTDWAKYDRIDYEHENVIELFQGARVSYEGRGAPQPSVGFPENQSLTNLGKVVNKPSPTIEDFGKHNNGTYQTALELGRKLGVFASSDHIAQHTAYGGVFCEDFTREGIIEAFDQRRTIAATDKIYLNFTCNGEPLGSILETDGPPKLWFKIDGTAPLKKVTIVRNESDWKIFDQIEGNVLEESIVDDA
ncbi:MAG: hypothetical protein AAF226_04220, partial [Verrucomicrobiota bacterium]